MNIAKLLVSIFLIGIVSMSVSLSSCKKCEGEKPSARIINDGTKKASVQIKTSGGNTININNVDPGTASPYSSYDTGQVVFTITVDSNNYVDTVLMAECFYYDIAIDNDNVITTTPIDRK